MRTELGYGEYIIKQGFCDYWVLNGMFVSGGKLYLTNKRLIFEAVKVQFIVKEFEIYHSEIEKLDDSGILLGITVHTVDKKQFKFRAFNRGEWVKKISEEVEEDTYRSNLYNEKDLDRKNKIGIEVTAIVLAVILIFGAMESESENSKNTESIVNENKSSSINETNDINLGWNKDRIHQSLSQFERPVSEFETKSLKFRIDVIEGNKLRMAVWQSGYSLESQPLEILDYSFLEIGEDGLPFMSFVGSWHYTVRLDKDFKPISVEVGGGEDKPEVEEIIKTTYFSNPSEIINTSNVESSNNKNITNKEITSILESSSFVVNELKVIKRKHGKALVYINETYENPMLAIVNSNNSMVEFSQYGKLSGMIDTTISDKSRDIYWVIKTEVFNKETYIDNIGLINMNLLTGEIAFTSEYPATMEADWLSYSREDYNYLNIDLDNAYELTSIDKNDFNGDGYEDFTINARGFNGNGYVKFYAKAQGFSLE